MNQATTTLTCTAGLAYPASIPGKIVTAWRQGALRVVLSHDILDEMARALPRLPRVTLNAANIRDLCDCLMLLADIIDPSAGTDEALRDPADQPVLQTLLASYTQYLITGDKDLLALAGAYPIITSAGFWGRNGM